MRHMIRQSGPAARASAAGGALVALALAVSAGPAAAAPSTSSAFPLIKLPPGYTIEKVVDGLTLPTSLTFDDRGQMFVAEAGGGFLPEPAPARILKIEGGKALPVVNLTKTGVADSVVGLQWHEGEFFFTHRNSEDFTGAVSKVTFDGRRELLITGFQDSRAEHQVNDVRLGPDGRMYLAVGPAFNSAVPGPDVAAFVRMNPDLHTTTCRPLVLNGINYESPNFLTDKEGDVTLTGAFVPFGQATEPGQRIEPVKKCGGAVYSFNPDRPAASLKLVADGLRNVIGFAWDSKRRMYAAVNGYDVRGVRPIKDEFDPTYFIRTGTWYGFPDFSAALEPVTKPKFDVPDQLQGRQFRGTTPLPPMNREPHFVINHRASGLTPPDRSLIAGLHQDNSSPSELDVAPRSWGRLADQAFVAEWGILAPATDPLQDKPTGFQVTRIDPETKKAVPFVRNVMPGPGSMIGGPGGSLGQALERPYDVKFGPDGAMYIVDFGQVLVNQAKAPPPYEFPKHTGMIWKVTRTAAADAAESEAASGAALDSTSGNPMLPSAPVGLAASAVLAAGALGLLARRHPMGRAATS
jgi:glucose/arabinose dehydrogenase